MNLTVTGGNCTCRTQLDPRTQKYVVPADEPIICEMTLRPYHRIDEGDYAEVTGKAVFHIHNRLIPPSDGATRVHYKLMCKVENAQGHFLVIQCPEQPLGFLIEVSKKDFNWICSIEKMMEEEARSTEPKGMKDALELIRKEARQIRGRVEEIERLVQVVGMAVEEAQS
jgi:hypothetical protein